MDETGLKLRKLIAVEADICLCGPVITEVLQGVTQDKLRSRITDLFEVPDYLATDRGMFEYAAEIYTGCKMKGFTIRSTQDCIIAATAITHEAHLLHKDRDYDIIARFYPLKIF